LRPEVVHQLLEVNQRFYEEFGEAFAETRRRIQPGVRRVLACVPPDASCLDLGCGSGSLAVAWMRQGRAGRYLGVDASSALLAAARRALREAAPPPPAQIDFLQADLAQVRWEDALPVRRWDVVCAFAMLHHFPGTDSRQKLIIQIRGLLPSGGLFILSAWQFLRSPKLRGRCQPWSLVGLEEDALDEGDYLLDWRHVPKGEPPRQGLRYVHSFSEEEWEALRATGGFSLVERFDSDGERGDLSTYQIWRAA
jgi:SAM-dependent methyltransferase